MRIFLRQRRNALQGIKEEMRMELGLEHLQFALCERAAQVALFNLLDARSIVKLKGMRGRNDQDVAERIVREARSQQGIEGLPVSREKLLPVRIPWWYQNAAQSGNHDHEDCPAQQIQPHARDHPG